VFRHAAERGLASLIARWMLEGRHDTIFRSIERSGALPPEEIDTLREEIRAHLEKVRDEGAPYADLVMATVGDLLPGLTGLAKGARSVALSAAAQALHTAGDALDGVATTAEPTTDPPADPPAESPPEPTEPGGAS